MNRLAPSKPRSGFLSRTKSAVLEASGRLETIASVGCGLVVASPAGAGAWSANKRSSEIEFKFRLLQKLLHSPVRKVWIRIQNGHFNLLFARSLHAQKGAF